MAHKDNLELEDLAEKEDEMSDSSNSQSNEEPGSSSSFVIREPGPQTPDVQRRYYHSKTYEPIHNDLSDDSEDEMWPPWMLKKQNLLVDEFTDIGEDEKEFMKMWNSFIMNEKRRDTPCRASCHIIPTVTQFYQEHGLEIIKKGLYYSGIVHLCSMRKNVLLTPSQLVELAQILRAQAIEFKKEHPHEWTRINDIENYKLFEQEILADSEHANVEKILNGYAKKDGGGEQLNGTYGTMKPFNFRTKRKREHKDF